jgi:predicted transcriptional regulator
MSKDEILRLIERMPESATETDVMEELYFRLQIEKGMKDVTEGRVMTHAELRNRVAQWRRSAGR